MKKRFLPLLMAIALLLGTFPAAFADAADFTDISGHWAENAMLRAVSDGLLEGFEDSTLRPDEEITCAQIITVLCRVLDAQGTDGTDTLGLSGDEWYAEAAGKALHLGLISEGDALDAPMTRLSALLAVSRAFQLSLAEPELTAARAYSDFGALSREDARVIGSLVELGYIQGYGGSLHLSDGITRAELVTVLYRVAGEYLTASEARAASENAVLYGGASLSGLNLSGNVWLACSAGTVTLKNVTAPSLTIRSESVGTYSFSGNNIDRLVVANVTGDMSISVDSTSSIGVIAVGDGSGSLRLSGKLSEAETIGTDRKVKIASSMEELRVSGSGNSVVIEAGVSVERLSVSGIGNSVVVNGSVAELSVAGDENSVSGSGRADRLTLSSASSDVTLAYTDFVDRRDPGISEAVLTLTAPETLPAGTELCASVTFTNVAAEKDCTGVWYLDGKAVRTEEITVAEGGTSEFSYSFEYSPDLQESCSLSYVLSYTTETGESQEKSASAEVTLENYDSSYYDRYSESAVLKTVTSAYAGDYTLKWAQEHDYDAQTKTVWVNAKGYSSSSRYLLWVNLTYQRVNVFEGSAGNWTLINEYICASGANDCTPRGVFTVFGKLASGWTTSTYNCRPVVNWKTGSGYAFHSRLYDPTHSYLTDANIGFPVSHGCIRMYDADVQWIYDNIPIGTTVVVY